MRPDGGSSALPKGLSFYHRMPFGPDDRWRWDLQGDEARYLGHLSLAGKRVLEVGCANGGLTFWMDGQGADVVAVDLGPDPDATPWDVLLGPGDDLDTLRAEMSGGAKRGNASWRYAREHYGARAELVLSTIYDIPRSLGTFDVVTLGAILLHLRDPLRALEHVVRFTRDAVVITDLMPFHLDPAEIERPLAYFDPSPTLRGSHGGFTWWHLSPALLERYLGLKGFAIERRTVSEFRHESGPMRMYTIVARRSLVEE